MKTNNLRLLVINMTLIAGIQAKEIGFGHSYVDGLGFYPQYSLVVPLTTNDGSSTIDLSFNYIGDFSLTDKPFPERSSVFHMQQVGAQVWLYRGWLSIALTPKLSWYSYQMRTSTRRFDDPNTGNSMTLEAYDSASRPVRFLMGMKFETPRFLHWRNYSWALASEPLVLDYTYLDHPKKENSPLGISNFSPLLVGVNLRCQD